SETRVMLEDRGRLAGRDDADVDARVGRGIRGALGAGNRRPSPLGDSGGLCGADENGGRPCPGAGICWYCWDRVVGATTTSKRMDTSRPRLPPGSTHLALRVLSISSARAASESR